MTKLIATLLAAVALVACSEAETANPEAAARTGDEPTAPAGPGPAPCTEQASKPSERKTPTTFEACEGLWRCDPTMGEQWMRPDGEACVVGRTTKLFSDGRATSESNEGEIKGTWVGDAFYMTLSFEPDAYGVPHEVTCERLPEQPSK